MVVERQQLVVRAVPVSSVEHLDVVDQDVLELAVVAMKKKKTNDEDNCK